MNEKIKNLFVTLIERYRNSNPCELKVIKEWVSTQISMTK